MQVVPVKGHVLTYAIENQTRNRGFTIKPLCSFEVGIMLNTQRGEKCSNGKGQQRDRLEELSPNCWESGVFR